MQELGGVKGGGVGVGGLVDAQAEEGWKADVLHESVVDQTDNVIPWR